MTPAETLASLRADGFLGARVVGGPEIVFLHEGDSERVVVDVHGSERILTAAAFEAEFTGCRFRIPTAEEAARS